MRGLRGLLQGILKGGLDQGTLRVAAGGIAQLLQPFLPLSQPEQRDSEIHVESGVFGIECYGVAVLLQCSPQVAGFFQGCTFVVELQRGKSRLAFLVDLAQECGEFLFDACRLVQFAVLA